MSKSVVVSICLPVFNGARFLRAALESILSQTYANFELLITDDKSTDGSVELIREFEAKDKRIAFQQNSERLGLFGNYNQCLARASGKYIKLMAQDDLLLPGALEAMVEALENNPDCTLANIKKQNIDDAGNLLVADPFLFEQGRHNGKEVSLSCLYTYRNLIGEPSTVLFRRLATPLLFDTNYHSLGDLDLWLRLLERGDFYFIKDLGVSFRQHNESQTQKLLSNLSWVLDFMRLGHQYKSLIAAIDLSEDEYLTRATMHLGIFVESLVSSRKVDMEKMDGFKELAFYCLRALGQIEPERIILKDKCDGMKKSMSWKITRPLRIAKATFSGLPQDVVD